LTNKNNYYRMLNFSKSNALFTMLLTNGPDMKSGAANLLFLDQNGVDQITEAIFRSIVAMPKTDLIFFISSSVVNRFKTKLRKYVPITDDDIKKMNINNVHRLLANAYRSGYLSA